MDRSTWTPLEQALRRKLAPEEIGSVRSLNDFPLALLAEARRLPSLARRDFLRALVDPTSRRDVGTFEDAVFERREDPRTWRRGGVVGPWFTPLELTSLSVEEILAPLGHARGQPWVRMPIDEARWRLREPFPGAPVVPCDDADYRTVVAPHAMRQLPPVPPLVSVADVVVATRRWMASHLAQAGRPRPGVAEATTEEELLRRIGAGQLSSDAAIAVKALFTERSLHRSQESGVPGFIGPDAWYVDSPAP